MTELVAGSTYTIRLEAEADLFPAEARYYGEARRAVADSAPLMSVSSDAGSVIRINARALDVTFAGAMTKDWRFSTVIFDLWRVDLADPRIWTATVQVPVVRPATPRPQP